MDTNAIEGVFSTDRGFTRTIAEKAGAWEHAMEVKGAHVRPAFEDTLAGFDLILDRVTGSRPVTEHFIRELHATMLRSQDTHTVYVSVGGALVPQEQDLPKGEYKRTANSPTRPDGAVHSYAPVEETTPEMGRLVGELRSTAFADAHPIVQAAYAHYAFVCIHPFADGNGRVARALASVYFFRSPRVPLVVYQDQRTRYIDALEAADGGRYHSLMRFFAERVTDTVNLIESEPSRPAGDSSADELARLLDTDANPDSVKEAAARLKEILRESLRSRVEARSARLGLKFQTLASLVGAAPPVPEGYRAISDEAATGVVVNARSPMKLFVVCPVAVYVKASDAAEFDLLAVTGSGRQLGVYLREVVPAVSENLRERVGFYADAVVDEFLGMVAEAARPERHR